MVVNRSRNEVEHGIGRTRVRCLVDDIPAVGAATPAEVEVEHVVVVVAIANESVATAVLTAAVIHRPAHVELFAHHGLPFLKLEVVATKLHYSIAIVEIVVHHTRNGTRSAPAAIGAIAHVDGHAAMKAQRTRGQFLDLRRVGVQHIGHIIPVVSRTAKVGADLTIVVMIVAMAAYALDGIGPKTHQLRHGRCQATHIGVATRTRGVGRTETIVGIVLVPFGLAEIARTATAVARNEAPVRQHRLPLGSHQWRCDRIATVAQPQNVFGDAVEIIRQRRRDIRCIEDRLVGIADDGAIGIVASDDDESICAQIEDKEGFILARINQFGHRTVESQLRCGKLLCRRLCLAGIDGLGLQYRITKE